MSFSARGSVSGKMSIDSSPTTSDYTITMPPEQGGANTVLQNDGTGTLSWETIESAGNSGGDVVGPASATDNAVARFDTTTGKLLKNGTVRINDNPQILGASALGLSGSTSGVLTLRASDTTTDHRLKMPPEQGAANTVIKHDGDEILSWTLPGRLNTQYFLESGSHTYTPTAGTTRALVYLTGGGGAGGGASGVPSRSIGSGGNSGATIIGFYSISGSTGTVTVGAGGQGVLGQNGGNGSNSVFLYPASGEPFGQITAEGGYGGEAKVGGGNTYVQSPPYAVAWATFSDLNSVLSSIQSSLGRFGSNGRGLITDVGEGGNGANSLWGGGGAGGVRNGSNGTTAGNNAAVGSGSGGGGAVQTNGGSSTGGAGGSGRCVIYEF